jgi:hypothetical protein
MVPPIQVAVQFNLPVKCVRTDCGNVITNPQEAVLVMRHVMVVAYCCPECYLETWRRQLATSDPIRMREDCLDDLGYYQEQE